MPSTTAAGYAILLSAGDLTISFPALTDGNVVDACFGYNAHSTTGNVADVKAAIKNTKEGLRKLTQGEQQGAVDAYERVFEVVKEYSEAVNDAGVIKCCKEGEIRRMAREELLMAFVGVNVKKD